MKGDTIILNGKPADNIQQVLEPEYLLGTNYIYQRVVTAAHKPLHLSTHLALAEVSFDILYGAMPVMNFTELEENIGTVLRLNRYPTGWNLVTVYLLPNGGKADVMVSVTRQMLYPNYIQWHSQPSAIVVPYEVPFQPHRTAASLMAHSYAGNYASRKGAQAAVAENFSGIATGVGEYPLFAVRGNEVHTSRFGAGIPDSVERRLGMMAAAEAGFVMTEQDIETAVLGDYDELFYVDPQGIVSIGKCNGKLYTHTAAKAIADRMSTMASLNI